jgi:hypothetical protein
MTQAAPKINLPSKISNAFVVLLADVLMAAAVVAVIVTIAAHLLALPE